MSLSIFTINHLTSRKPPLGSSLHKCRMCSIRHHFTSNLNSRIGHSLNSHLNSRIRQHYTSHLNSRILRLTIDQSVNLYITTTALVLPSDETTKALFLSSNRTTPPLSIQNLKPGVLHLSPLNGRTQRHQMTKQPTELKRWPI